MPNDEPMEPEVVDVEPTTALATVDTTLPQGIFPYEPAAAMRRARAVVQEMHALVKDSGEARFISTIEGRPYPQVTWWTTIAFPLGLSPTIVWTRRIDTEEGSGYDRETWQARCEVIYVPTGMMVASGEGLCSMNEQHFSRKQRCLVDRWTDSHAVMAMAQTRAIGRTFRQCLAGLAVMAGLEATPYEEMPRGEQPAQRRAPSKPKAGERSAADLTVSTKPQPLGYITAVQDPPWEEDEDGGKEKWVEVEGIKGRLYTTSNPHTHKWWVGSQVEGIVMRATKSGKGWPYAVVGSIRRVTGEKPNPPPFADGDDDDDFGVPDAPQGDSELADAQRVAEQQADLLIETCGQGAYLTLCKRLYGQGPDDDVIEPQESNDIAKHKTFAAEAGKLLTAHTAEAVTEEVGGAENIPF